MKRPNDIGIFQNPVRVVVSLAIVAVMAGCSVEDRRVVNEPPIVRDTYGTFDVEFGVLSPEQITAFFLPAHLTEAEVEESIYQINSKTLVVDKLSADFEKSRAKAERLKQDFVNEDCVGRWALRSKYDPGLGVAKVKAWKKLDPVDKVEAVPETDPRYEEYQRYLEYLRSSDELKNCQDNQEFRVDFPNLEDKTIKSVRSLYEQIFQIIDPGYNQKTNPVQENYKEIGKKGTRLELSPDGENVRVDLTLADFFREGHVFSTDEGVLRKSQPECENGLNPDLNRWRIRDATYNTKGRMLRFSLSEMKPSEQCEQEGVPTGAVIEFALARAPDFLGRARFSGDMNLVQDGRVIRYGIAKFEGLLIPDAPRDDE